MNSLWCHVNHHKSWVRGQLWTHFLQWIRAEWMWSLQRDRVYVTPVVISENYSRSPTITVRHTTITLRHAVFVMSPKITANHSVITYVTHITYITQNYRTSPNNYFRHTTITYVTHGWQNFCNCLGCSIVVALFIMNDVKWSPAQHVL